MSSSKKSLPTDNADRYFISVIGTGLGDLILCLPAIQALIKRGKPVYLVKRSQRQNGIVDRVEGLYGELDEAQLELAAGDVYINLRQHPLQTDHIWGTPEFEKFFGPSDMEKITASICADFGLHISYSNLEAISYFAREDLRDCIAFIPGSDGFYKHWPHEHWLELRQMLERAGHKIIVLGRPEESPPVKRLLESGMNWVESKGLAEAVDIISSVKLVLSVDTGLMHLAVQQNIACIALLHPRNFHRRSAPHCFNLLANPCPESCGRDQTLKAGFQAASSLEVALKYDSRECQLPLSQNCMAAIKPDEVLKTMEAAFANAASGIRANQT